MRITREADYAIRITYVMAKTGGKISAREISEAAGVTLRFTLKILRKLIQMGLAHSYKGKNGGYALNKPAPEISLGEIIEGIDGKICINHCLSGEYDCTRLSGPDKRCEIQKVLLDVNARLQKELYAVKLDAFL